MTQEKIRKLEQLLHSIKGASNTYVTNTGDYFYIHDKNLSYNIGSGNYNELMQFIKAIKTTRYNKYNSNTFEKCIRVCSMITNILAYSSCHTVDNVVNNSYLQNDLYSISNYAKKENS